MNADADFNALWSRILLMEEAIRGVPFLLQALELAMLKAEESGRSMIALRRVLEIALDQARDLERQFDSLSSSTG